MFLSLFFSVVAIFILLCVTEYLWRTKKVEVEVSRKIVHMGTGVIIASWPHYLDWIWIQLLSAALLAVVLVSHKYHIFKSIHEVKRITKGEILFPIGVGLCALLQPSPWVFTVAILHLALADGIAAIVGVKYGHKTKYSLLSHGKTLVGSSAFLITSFVILTVASFVVSENALPHLYGWFILTAFTLTLTENVSWYGLDDITVPVAVVAILSLLPT